MSNSQTPPAAPGSAIAALRALSAKKATTESTVAFQVTDPAIAGASRKGKSSVVTLGFDPAFAEKAAQAAQLRAAMDEAKAAFEVLQGTVRDYGAEKRGKYNDSYKADVTTVQIPYKVEVPNDQNSATPGSETKFVQVICSNKYAVAADIVLGNEDIIGADQFKLLFVKDEEKVLKPNAEELIRGVFSELGLSGTDLETTMQTLFDTKVKVSTTETYEKEIKSAPEAIRTLLSQAVTRAQPGLKFP